MSGFSQSPLKKLTQVSFTGGDADALNYIGRVEAAGRTLSNGEKRQINTYVVGLKAAGVWTKIHERWILCWGVAAANAEGLKGVSDITWNGTVTHGSTGATGNGSTGYGNTGITPSTSLTLNNTHMALYSQTNSAITNGADMGCRSSNSSSLLTFLNSGGNLIADQYTISAATGRLTFANSNTQGYFIASRISSTDLKVYKNGSQLGTLGVSSTGTLPTIAIVIMAANMTGSTTNFTNRTYSMCSVGTGLSSTEAADDNTLTEAFMDARGIGVQ